MAELVWDQIGEHFFETGVDHGVLYTPDAFGAYINGFAWNGLTNITESPSGAEPNAQWADNIKYLNLYSAEEFSATLEAFTYPDAFAEYDGLAVPTPGVVVGQQPRKGFGLSYRTKLGSDLDEELGYKLHLVYGCKASPSEKSYATVNDSPEAATFSWEIATTPVAVGIDDMKPTSLVVIDSTKVDADVLADLEQILYGDVAVDPALPPPATIITMFQGGVTSVTPLEPAFDSGTETITIPTVVGVTYYVDGEAVAAGPLVITEDTVVTARPNAGYVFTPGSDDDWAYDYTP